MQTDGFGGSVDSRLELLQNARRYLRSLPAFFDMPLPTLVSHAGSYAEDAARLKDYASSVIPVRLMQLTTTSFMKTLYFVELYLGGIESGNAYALPLAARAQMELFAVCWDVSQIVERNRGASEDRLAERVKEVDEALINATFGSRDPRFFDGLRRVKRVSGLRQIVEGDFKPLTASNVLTRLDRLSRVARYSACRQEYDHLCEVLHPNMGQSLVLMRPHPERDGDVRFARDRLVLERLMETTSEPMAIATDGTISSLNAVEWPFGWHGRREA
jgi:hypothetical protein